MQTKHGLTIGLQRVGSKFFLTLKAQGTLTHEDYETITPMLDNALEGVKKPKIRALIDCSELEGWELQAAWDDFKLALKHGNEFEKIAMIGGKDWVQLSSKIASWFMQGEIKTFEDEKDAYKWLDE
jgi:hypothetical protein